MLSDEIRTRLAKLHAAAPAPAVPQAAQATTPRRAQTALFAPRESDFDRDPLALGQEQENASGRHLRFRRPVAELWPQVDRAIARVATRGRDVACGMHPELAALAGSFPRDVLFLDLETCGFAGSVVFLAGLAWFDGSLMIDQLFARTYAEERALLDTLWQIAGRKRVLVTFNGKSFDWPMVHDRSTRHHLGRDGRPRRRGPRRQPDSRERQASDGYRPELVHCDLLHHARRRWKHVLPDCRLTTLERYVCRRARADDLPGALVPAAYHDYVRSGRPGPLGAILRHNAQDLATLAELACRLLVAGREAPAVRPAKIA